jgi:hypothetical protein
LIARCCTCSKSAAKSPLKVVTHRRPGARLGRRPASKAFLHELQPPIEIARLDRPDKGVDDRRNRGGFAGRDRAVGQCRSDRLHRGGDIGGALDRGQREFDGAFAAGRQDPFEAEPHRCRIADQRELDSLARQSLRLAREQRRGGRGRLVARARPAATRIARPPLFERPPASSPRRF